MRRLRDLGTNRSAVSEVDPYHYVRQADLALLYGSREDALALISKAYVAFDLVPLDGDVVTTWGRAWPGRSS